AAYRKVLADQKIPSLETLFRLFDAARLFLSDTIDYRAALTGLAAAAEIKAVEVPKKLPAPDQKILQSWSPSDLAGPIRDLQQQTGRKKPNPKSIKEHASVLLDRLRPQVVLALTGSIYALYLRPSDAAISDDPLLVRKHTFIGSKEASRDLKAFPDLDFHISSEGAGSRFIGGFGGVEYAMGIATERGQGGNNRLSQSVGVSAWAAVRSTDWRLLREEQIRVFALRVRLGREWIVEAAGNPERSTLLAEETLGLLSLSRRGHMFDALAARKWLEVWECLTLSDLYWLGEAAERHYGKDLWPSPVAVALRAAPDDWKDAPDVLGVVPVYLSGCQHPHWSRYNPYESYTRQMFANKFAERTAELKARVALILEENAIAPASLADAAEPLTTLFLSRLRMRDKDDWPSIQAALRELNQSDVQAALESARHEP
ncbi:MAG: hypothetical protein ABI693_11640, partial [Bryobacteraceae bacterium]